MEEKADSIKGLRRSKIKDPVERQHVKDKNYNSPTKIVKQDSSQKLSERRKN